MEFPPNPRFVLNGKGHTRSTTTAGSTSAAEMFVEECRDLSERLPGLGYTIVKLVLSVRLALVNFELRLDASPPKFAAPARVAKRHRRSRIASFRVASIIPAGEVHSLCNHLPTMAKIVSPSPAEHHLHRQLGLRDLVLAQILCVVGSSWVGVAAGLGRAQALTWVAAMLLFYIPMAASVICLNRAWPLEGGLYVWAHRAYGDLGGFLTAWNLWVYGIVVTAAILYAIPTELAYLIGPSAVWLPRESSGIACNRHPRDRSYHRRRRSRT